MSNIMLRCSFSNKNNSSKREFNLELTNTMQELTSHLDAVINIQPSVSIEKEEEDLDYTILVHHHLVIIDLHDELFWFMA